jgi:hypothetical protein
MSAVLLPQLEDDVHFNVTKSELSWIASITVLPMAPGCLLGNFDFILIEINF